MKSILFTITILSQSLFAGDMERILSDHFERLESIKTQRLNFYERMIAKSLRQFAGARLNKRTVNYLAVHEQYIFKFKSASEQANLISERFCGEGQKSFNMLAHYNDEADALRHLIWSGYLAFYLGESAAFALSSLHEDKPHNHKDQMQMDLWNNHQGITHLREFKTELKRLNKSGRQKLMLKKMLELLDSGDVKVLKSSPSHCQRPQLYPNFKLKLLH